jgi:preprotein translocase subunit SecG
MLEDNNLKRLFQYLAFTFVGKSIYCAALSNTSNEPENNNNNNNNNNTFSHSFD